MPDDAWMIPRQTIVLFPVPMKDERRVKVRQLGRDGEEKEGRKILRPKILCCLAGQERGVGSQRQVGAVGALFLNLFRGSWPRRGPGLGTFRARCQVSRWLVNRVELAYSVLIIMGSACTERWGPRYQRPGRIGGMTAVSSNWQHLRGLLLSGPVRGRVDSVPGERALFFCLSDVSWPPPAARNCSEL